MGGVAATSASVVQVAPSVRKEEDQKLELYQERKDEKYWELEPYQKEIKHAKVGHVFKVGGFHENTVQNEIGIHAKSTQPVNKGLKVIYINHIGNVLICSLVPRPSHRSVFDRLQYAKTEGKGLVSFIT